MRGFVFYNPRLVMLGRILICLVLMLVNSVSIKLRIEVDRKLGPVCFYENLSTLSLYGRTQ